MTNESLFQAILDNPDDDTPRLVYADWLEENGDPDWAERIRIECELPLHDAQDIAPKLHDLRKRRELLIRKHREAWKTSKFQSVRLLWQRGFLATEGAPEIITNPGGADWWNKHKERIGWVSWAGKKIQPGIAVKLPPDLVERTAEIRRTGSSLLRKNEIVEIACYPNVRRLRCSYPGLRSNTSFAPWEGLTQLRSLNVLSQNHFVSEAEAESLPAFANLRQLHFEHGIDGNAVRELRKFKNLEELDLGHVLDLQPESLLQLEALSKLRNFRFFVNAGMSAQNPPSSVLPKWPELRELNIRNWRSDDELGSLEHFPKLERLTLSALGGAGDPKLSLSEMPTLSNLRCLHLHRSYRRLTGLGVLKYCRKLQELRIGSEADLDEWQHLPSLPGLKTLEHPGELWPRTRLHKQTAEIIIDRFPNVERLMLPGSPDVDAVKVLTQLKHVKILELGYGRTPAVWKALKEFRGLTYLKLRASTYDEKIGHHLKRFPALEILDMRGDWLASDKLPDIRKHCPKLVVLK